MTDESPPSILGKAFTLLQAFSPDRRVMSLSEISRASGLPKSTVHRLLARLIDLGAVEHHRSGYRIGLMMLQIGATAPAIAMRDVASPHLAALHHRTGLTVHLAVLRGFDVVILERLSRYNAPRTTSGIGTRLPANCSALGKVLLAFEDIDDLEMFLPRPMPSMTPGSTTDVGKLVTELREVRDVSAAREANESHVGMACTAVPVMVMGSAVAAMSIAYPAGSSPPPAGLRGTLRDVASRIANDVSTALRQGRAHWFPREIDSEDRGEARPHGGTADREDPTFQPQSVHDHGLVLPSGRRSHSPAGSRS